MLFRSTDYPDEMEEKRFHGAGRGAEDAEKRYYFFYFIGHGHTRTHTDVVYAFWLLAKKPRKKMSVSFCVGLWLI